MAENDDFTPMFGKGAPNEAFAQYFIGNSYLNPLTSAAECGVGLANVTFEPGCRNNWHIHHAFEAPGEGCSNEWLEPVDDASYPQA